MFTWLVKMINFIISQITSKFLVFRELPSIPVEPILINGMMTLGLGHPEVKNRFLWAWWGEKMPVGRSGFFFFPNFNFFKLECTGGKVKKKKVPVGPF